MRFSFTIVHVPEKKLNTAGTLFRSPVSEGEGSRDKAFHHEVKAYMNMVVKSLPATTPTLPRRTDQRPRMSQAQGVAVSGTLMHIISYLYAN